MAEISKLIEIFNEGNADLAHSLLSDSLNPGLVHFLSILEAGIGDGDDGRPGFSSWTRPQIEAVVAVSKQIISIIQSSSAGNAEPVVVLIVQKSLEFCISFMEKSVLEDGDFSLQNDLVQLMEIALADGVITENDVRHHDPIGSCIGSLSSIPVRPCSSDLTQSPVCNLQGNKCLKNGNSAERVFKTLASELLLPDSKIKQYTESSIPRSSDSMLSLGQHWAVIHLKFFPRLFGLCKALLQPPISFEEQKEEDAIFCLRLSLCHKIMKLLGNLTSGVGQDSFDTELLCVVGSCAYIFPTWFRLKIEFVNYDSMATGNSLLSLLSLVLEEYLHLVQTIFLDGNIYQNVQARLVASMLDILESGVWRYDRSNSSPLRAPLIYHPQSVLYLLKLFKDSMIWGSQASSWKEKLGTDLPDHPGHISSEDFSLLEKYKSEEYVRMLFPPSKQRVDALIHTVFFLHCQVVKSRPNVDKPRSILTKTAIVLELDSVSSHEEEALFGNLFSEASRPVGPVDGLDQPAAATTVTSNSHNLLIQAVAELSYFLKVYIFSPEQNSAVFEEASKKIEKDHIDYLLSILNCQACNSDERILVHVNENCFELLRNLLVHRVLSASLVEYLVDQVLKVEKGAYVYNNYTLALLAHALISRTGMDGISVTIKAFKGYGDFVLEKAQSICLICPESSEFFATLPSAFHLEILLTAFHLANESEKVALVDSVCSSLRTIDTPPAGLSGMQLFYWTLIVSRLVLVLRHMVLYPSFCPSWLLSRLRSRLRGLSQSLIDHLPSCASALVECILGDSIKDVPVICDLLPQLVDVAPLPSASCRDECSFQNLRLNLDDLIAIFSRTLDVWRGNKAEAVEHLIIERYIFLLCWDTLSSITFGVNHSLILKNHWRNLDLWSTESFFRFSLTLVGNNGGVCQDVAWSEVIFNLLKQINVDQLTHVNGWDFFKMGSWISLILSLFHAGMWRYSVRHAVPGFELYRIQYPKDTEFFHISDNLIDDLIQSNKGGCLLNALSIILKMYLEVLQGAFLSILDSGRPYGDGFSPLLLLKHTGFDKCRHDLLLEKSSSKTMLLESMYNLLPKLNEIASKEDTVNSSVIFLRCLLHGFPSCSDFSSGVFLSCVLMVREAMCTLDGYLKIKDAAGMTHEQSEVVSQLLDTVMCIKYDKIFQPFHGKCDAVFESLVSHQKEMAAYGDLFPLKQIEDFLSEMNSKEAKDIGTHEILISSLVDSIEGLRRDNSKAGNFKFYMGCDEDLSEEAKKLFSQQRGNLLVLVEALDKCHTETVNLKVLNLFVDLLSCGICPGLKEEMQKKFLEMDLACLSSWLENRLLGSTQESLEGVITAKGSSIVLRESTMHFITRIVSQSSEISSEELHSRLFGAMLSLIDSAFLSYDVHTAKAYFSLIVQLMNGEGSMRLLLEKTLLLMEKLADNDGLLQGLRFLLSFLGAVLGDCGAHKNSSDKHSTKICSSDGIGSGSVVPKPAGPRKDTESLVLPANQSGPASMDCDATSADEDEDDGTSDGELASIDKDEEDDSNSERVLASKVCTFTSSGSNFMEQHWYFCYTCDLTVTKGCCSICAKVCHRGHRVVYSRSSRFFCDCGAGGVRGSSCQCLKPRKFSGSNNSAAQCSSSFQPFLPFPEDGDLVADSDSDVDDDVWVDTASSINLSIPRELQDKLPILLENLDMEGRVLELCSRLLPTLISRRESNLSKDKEVVLGNDKFLSYNVDLFQLKKSYKSGSLDLKIKADYPNSRELKSHLSSGSLAKSLLSVSLKGRVAAGEGDRVAIYDVGQLIGQPTVAPVTADKANIKPISKNVVRFEIVHLIFNPVVENYLAVAGYEECQVLTVNPRGEVTDRLAIELALQGAYIRRVEWVPGSQVQLMVVTNMFVKIYDLSQDSISPIHYSTLSEDLIVDATLVPASMGKVFLLVLTDSGCLFRLDVSMEGDVGAKALTETIRVQEKDIQPKGLSLYYSLTYRLLFLFYQDGTSLLGRLDANATSLTEISSVNEEEQDGKAKPAGMHHWKELLPATGVFVCFSSLKSNAAVAISMGPNELFAQNMRYGAGSALPVVGVAACKPLSKDKTHCLVLYEDGSLQIYSHIPVGADMASNACVEETKKLRSSILKNRNDAGSNPEFPLDFFEKTMCITPDVKFSSDAIKNSDSEGIKQRLASDDGFLESLATAGFKVTVSNSNQDMVMVGFRIHVGNTSASHIPSEVTIFQRVIKLDEGMRSWYDIPFTVAESLLADEEFTISVGRTLDGSTMPRVDSLEVYARAKDEFGWKEKMDAVLDMEARVLGTTSGASGPGKKYRSSQAAPIQDQVLADALRLLSKFYSLCGPKYYTELDNANLDLDKLKTKKFLDTIFESDREPLLQSAACRVLQTMFPKREIYYYVKDTMRLFGVLKSIPMLISRIGIGGAAATWVIKEFTDQMHIVSKIALGRRSNMVTFLEAHGSGVVDGLMQVLWGILDLEQPDTQTINNIVIPSVELIYSYAECLALHGNEALGRSVAPAVTLLKKLLFAPYEAVQTSSSWAISSRLLQVPFPKQTMLTTDDASENSATTLVPSASVTSGNTQVMIEDDSTTSSVQFCCDGCSTVPILRRRWHCNVCPDFDLCEACYEVLDADLLPPPHSRDHPMSAIPIEVDSLGGDGNEIHFSRDDLNDAGLMQVASDSPSPIHIPEAHETGDFSASVNDQRIVSISASKRAVNSLLLRHLVAELKGWMETTSGVRAIPVMQLFYRLSSAVGGPFMDSSKPENLDLEKFVKWLLDEINLARPFPIKNRSFFGEVVILVFMFFISMLRNWQQSGSDTSQAKSGAAVDSEDKGSVQIPSSTPSFPSSNNDQEKNEFASQLIRACSFLRQQAFLNYLMDILQQLVHVSKSSSLNTESGSNDATGCGSLLTVRRELPAGNFSPFFSDSYAKAHRTDIFTEYHKLLLENTFRLVYTLVCPEKQNKLVEKDKSYKMPAVKDFNLDAFQDVLCSYLSYPNTSSVRRYARKLLLHLCMNKTQYYSVKDSWLFANEVKKLSKLINKSGGVHNPVPYERSVKLVKCLSVISEVAGARPRNWQKYCSMHTDLLPFLMNGIFHFGEESVIQSLKLLNLAFYTGKDMGRSVQKVESGDAGMSSSKGGGKPSDSKKKKKGEDGTESSSEKSCLEMEQAVEIFSDKDGLVLRRFINSFLLEWNSSSVRLEAKCVLYGVWHHAKQPLKESMLIGLLEKVKFLPMYGQNIVEYTELMTVLLAKVPDGTTKPYENEIVSHCLTPDVISCISETLHVQNELLANHPNSRIYNTLSGLVEFDGYYLESEPCVACSCPEVPYSRMKLESLKSETKFTDNRIIVKCTGSYTIQTVTMNVHDARKSKAVKVLNLYYNNRPVADLSELKNNWSLWKRAKSCHLAFNQTELKVEFPIPITACNFMIELDSFYENLQASSLESLQCPRCSRSVTDKHGICGNCHENAYQCRQCRNINYENLDSFLCNECGYSKYGRFEFNFMAKPSFSFDDMENDEDMKKGLAAIESESENAHRRYQQLLGFKKPLLKLVPNIGEHEIDSQQKDSAQQIMVSLPVPSCKINRKIALLGVLYGEKCKAAFDSVSKSVQTLQGLRRVLLTYLHQKNSDASASSRFSVPRSLNSCYGCATTFVTQCMELLQVVSKHGTCKKQLVASGILSELFENNIHQGPMTARVQARAVLCAFSEGDANAVAELNDLIQKKVMYCLEHHRSMDIALATREELLLLSETCSVVDEFWEARLRVAFQLLFSSIKLGSKHPAISEHIILPCLRIISQACTPPKSDTVDKDQGTGKPTSLSQPKNDHNPKSTVNSNNLPGESKSSPELSEKHWDGGRKGEDIPLMSYSEWERGASYLDFVRRQYRVSQAVKAITQKARQDSQKVDYLSLKYVLKWKRHACKRTSKSDFSKFTQGSWVSELILSACSQSIRSEVCVLIILLCPLNSSKRFQLLNLLMSLLPATLAVGESAAEYFELFFKIIDSEDARLFLAVRGCLTTICRLVTQEVSNVESHERTLSIDISQGFILHKLIELLSKFLEVPNIRVRFMRDELLSQVLEALLVIRGLIVQKTKLINDCNRLLKDLLDSLLLENSENKRQFIRACVSGLQNHGKERKGRTSLFILEQLCNMICPSKPEPVYLLILNKAHTQEEFIRGSMTKNPYSSVEIGPLMRDVKNKICHQLELLGLLEDDYGMELLVAGNIISLDLSISQVYEQVWKKYHSQSQSSLSSSGAPSSGGLAPVRDCPPMTVTYRLQGLDGEATEPMIKELEEEREESQDPEVEFAIAGAVREFGGLDIILSMIQRLHDDELKSNQEELGSVLNLLMYCCKIRENRRALLRLGALGLLLETARRAFSVDALEPAEGILLIVESLTVEANESDVSSTQSALTVSNEESGTGEQAKKIVLMFLERLCLPSGLKKSNKQQRNNEMVARILPYLTYGEPAAMEALVQHFDPYLQDWGEFDRLQKQHIDNTKDESLAEQAAKQISALENFVRVSESLKTSSCGERLKDIILEKGITSAAVRHLQECFAVAGQAGFRSSPEWASGLKLPSIPLILSMLRGLSTGHLATQVCIDEGGILFLLHALEGVAGENEIGARAENLLDTLAGKESNGDGFLGEKIHKLRHATRDEMRRLALKKREQLLQGLGMRQEFASDGGERIVVAQPAIEGLEDVQEEEDGLACMVCREGYSLRPNDMLGVYSYSKRVNLGASSSGSARGDCVYTTVSHFNIIHFQCHQEAKRADAALKSPKKEWEGATLRNNETLCNCIFPLRGPSVPLAQYVRCVDQYWDNLNALGRADGSRLRLLTYDVVLMLARFATGALFNADCKGGGRESNSCLLPFMIQMACHLLDQGSSSQPQRRAMAKSVTAYLSSSASSPVLDSPTRPSSPLLSARSPATPAEETVQFMMVNSLLSESYEDWSRHRRSFLQRGIYHAYMQYTHGRSTLRFSDAGSSAVRSDESSPLDPNDTGKLFAIIQPMLVYTGLVEQMQQFFKLSKASSMGPLKESEGVGLEKWEVVMREKLVNVKEMVGFSKELLSWLEDMTSAADLQEAFDVMGALGDALSGGFSKCEEFVQAAILAERS